MTDDEIALQDLLEKSSDASSLREMIGFAAQRLMALETDALCGAAHGERTAERINHRNGFRDCPMLPAPSGAVSPTSCARACPSSPD
jgi:putative transposase